MESAKFKEALFCICRPKRCCCCIPFRIGLYILSSILLFLGIWSSLVLFSDDVIAYNHIPKGVRIVMGIVYLLLIPVAIFGYCISRSSEKYQILFQRFSKIFWVAVLIIVLLTLIQLIHSFIRRKDLIQICEDDYNNGINNIFYIMTNNTDGFLVSETCQHAVDFSLALILFDFIVLKFCLWIYFGIIVELHSKLSSKKDDPDSNDRESIKSD
ncbi:hypothetical protein Glove_292g49 [Diversispora epigaea]|uniref:Uncharacterized protein n=1 Tax=Diversispora epigaea TaxID=1348612 RepID=A0A397I7S1_9GLOM|nr:hypothetical protein Glove_292g49 [Diversispora epigaea]